MLANLSTSEIMARLPPRVRDMGERVVFNSHSIVRLRMFVSEEFYQEFMRWYHTTRAKDPTKAIVILIGESLRQNAPLNVYDVEWNEYVIGCLMQTDSRHARRDALAFKCVARRELERPDMVLTMFKPESFNHPEVAHLAHHAIRQVPQSEEKANNAARQGYIECHLLCDVTNVSGHYQFEDGFDLNRQDEMGDDNADVRFSGALVVLYFQVVEWLDVRRNKANAVLRHIQHRGNHEFSVRPFAQSDIESHYTISTETRNRFLFISAMSSPLLSQGIQWAGSTKTTQRDLAVMSRTIPIGTKVCITTRMPSGVNGIRTHDELVEGLASSNTSPYYYFKVKERVPGGTDPKVIFAIDGAIAGDQLRSPNPMYLLGHCTYTNEGPLTHEMYRLGIFKENPDA